MAEDFNLLSKSLSSNYVYYKMLKDEENENYNNLYEAVLGKIQEAKAEASRTKIDTSFIIAQANAEREKELNLIERMTGFRPSSNDWGGDANNIIDAINLCLNSKDIYNRIYQTIVADGEKKGTQGKGMFSFFGGYLQSTINDMWPDFMTRFKNEKVFDITKDDLYKWITEEVLNKAIERMFEAQVEEGVDPELQGAYRDLEKLIGAFDKTGSFAAQLADIYDLDGVAKEIKDILSKRTTKKKPGTISSLTKQAKLTYQRGGYTLEALVDLMLERILPKDGKSGHITMGDLGARADNIFTVGIDFSEIQDFLENEEFGTREKNIRAFTELGEHLQKFQEGFIVYTSDKNYSLSDGFKSRGGFSTGEPMTLNQYIHLMGNAIKNVRAFVGAIEQLAEGAIGEEESHKDYADIISKNIAFLLFDDFNAIGAGLENGPQSIHIMNLNGLFVPISSILYALADALDEEKNISNIVYTSIHLPKIKYENGSRTEGYPVGKAWGIQRSEMLQQGKIETHFLGNIKKMLRDGKFR